MQIQSLERPKRRNQPRRAKEKNRLTLIGNHILSQTSPYSAITAGIIWYATTPLAFVANDDMLLNNYASTGTRLGNIIPKTTGTTTPVISQGSRPKHTREEPKFWDPGRAYSANSHMQKSCLLPTSYKSSSAKTTLHCQQRSLPLGRKISKASFSLQHHTPFELRPTGKHARYRIMGSEQGQCVTKHDQTSTSLIFHWRIINDSLQ